jgi:hypothetical protein
VLSLEFGIDHWQNASNSSLVAEIIQRIGYAIGKRITIKTIRPDPDIDFN